MQNTETKIKAGERTQKWAQISPDLRTRLVTAKRDLKAAGWTHIMSVMADNAHQPGVEDFGSLFIKDGKEYWLNRKTLDRLPTRLVKVAPGVMLTPEQALASTPHSAEIKNGALVVDCSKVKVDPWAAASTRAALFNKVDAQDGSDIYGSWAVRCECIGMMGHREALLKTAEGKIWTFGSKAAAQAKATALMAAISKNTATIFKYYPVPL